MAPRCGLDPLAQVEGTKNPLLSQSMVLPVQPPPHWTAPQRFLKRFWKQRLLMCQAATGTFTNRCNTAILSDFSSLSFSKEGSGPAGACVLAASMAPPMQHAGKGTEVACVCGMPCWVLPKVLAAQLLLIQRQLQLPPAGPLCCLETPAFHQNPAHIPPQLQPGPQGTTLTSLALARSREGCVLLSAELSH